MICKTRVAHELTCVSAGEQNATLTAPFEKESYGLFLLEKEKTIPRYRRKIKAFSLLENTIKSLGDLELPIKK